MRAWGEKLGRGPGGRIWGEGLVAGEKLGQGLGGMCEAWRAKLGREPGGEAGASTGQLRQR